MREAIDPATGRYVLLWITSVVHADDGNRAEVAEVRGGRPRCREADGARRRPRPPVPAGTSRRFGALVERHERRVYNLALRMTGREEDARDATQDAFLTALRKLSSFRGEAAFTTWLHRVTVNACYDLLRKRQRAPLLHEREDDDGPRGPSHAAPDHADAVDLSIDVQRALLRGAPGLPGRADPARRPGPALRPGGGRARRAGRHREVAAAPRARRARPSARRRPRPAGTPGDRRAV